MRGASKVTFQTHQVLRLQRNSEFKISARNPWIASAAKKKRSRFDDIPSMIFARDPSMIWPWHRRLAPAASATLLVRSWRRFCIEKYNMSRSGYLPKCHQMPRLPQKSHSNFTKCCACHAKWIACVDPLHICNMISNARSNKSHLPTSPNTVPARQNESHEWSADIYEPLFPMRGASRVTLQTHQVLCLPRNSEFNISAKESLNCFANRKTVRRHSERRTPYYTVLLYYSVLQSTMDVLPRFPGVLDLTWFLSARTVSSRAGLCTLRLPVEHSQRLGGRLTAFEHENCTFPLGRPAHCLEHENCTFPFFLLPMIFWIFFMIFDPFWYVSPTQISGVAGERPRKFCEGVAGSLSKHWRITRAGRNGAQTMQTETLAMVGMFWVSLFGFFFAALGPPLSQHDVPESGTESKRRECQSSVAVGAAVKADAEAKRRLGRGMLRYMWYMICWWDVFGKVLCQFLTALGVLSQSSSVRNIPNQTPSPKEKKTPLASSPAPVGAVVKADAHEAKRRVGRGMIRYMICWWDVFGEVFWSFGNFW